VANDFNFPSYTIPGNSLTKEPGNSPWEQPPMYVELPDVVDYYTEKLTLNESVDTIIEALKNQLTVVDLTNTFIKAGVMKGIHSIDVGMLAFPIIAEVVKTIADINDIGYVESEEDIRKATQLDEQTYLDLINESKTKVEEAIDEAVAPRKGLMSKGATE
jgi:hypothetical protein